MTGTRSVEERLPRRGARPAIVKPPFLHVGDALQEQGVGGMASVERFKQRECLRRLLLLPQVEQVQLIVGLAVE